MPWPQVFQILISMCEFCDKNVQNIRGCLFQGEFKRKKKWRFELEGFYGSYLFLPCVAQLGSVSGNMILLP